MYFKYEADTLLERALVKLEALNQWGKNGLVEAKDGVVGFWLA